MGHCQLDPNDAEDAHGKQQNEHGWNAFAGATHSACQYIQRTQQHIVGAKVFHRQYTVMNGSAVRGEQPHYRMGERQQQRAGQYGINGAHQQGGPHSAFDPL